MSIDPAAQLRHDLRTPLNHVIGYAEMLLEEASEAGDADVAARLRTLHAEARRLLTLLNAALTPAPGQPGPTDVAAARDTATPLLERILATVDALRDRATRTGADGLVPDLDRIRMAAAQLAA
ncbi:MAG TPA: histidine kinase dimerization/phospho-acceptor domain-containing protein, partial [Candidatus Tectomicrobia bacterium]|nr:histidine kinase dimerization/phospho-acceptor domain-containing protein [Candidatus Tectomicrobia bacterium]